MEETVCALHSGEASCDRCHFKLDTEDGICVFKEPCNLSQEEIRDVFDLH